MRAFATAILVLLALGGCKAFGGVAKPQPPVVTPCLSEPTGVYAPEPVRSKALTDTYVVELQAWARSVLGVATADRIGWKGERACIRALQAAGYIR